MQDMLNLGLFEPILNLNDGKTCWKCAHRERHEKNSKVFQYCAVKRSKRTENGLLKIKASSLACSLYLVDT